MRKTREYTDPHSVRENCSLVLDIVKMDKEKVYWGKDVATPAATKDSKKFLKEWRNGVLQTEDMLCG